MVHVVKGRQYSAYMHKLTLDVYVESETDSQPQ